MIISFLFLLQLSVQTQFEIRYGDLNYMTCDSLSCDLKSDLKDGVYKVYDDYKGFKYLRIRGKIISHKRIGLWEYWDSYENVMYEPNSIRDSMKYTQNDSISLGFLFECEGIGCDTTYILERKYYQNGNLEKRISFFDGKRFSEEIYNNGIEVKFIHWGANSTPFFTVEDKSKYKLVTSYYETGELKAKGKTTSDDIEFGKWKYWDKQGKLVKVKKYRRTNDQNIFKNK